MLRIRLSSRAGRNIHINKRVGETATRIGSYFHEPFEVHQQHFPHVNADSIMRF